MSTLAHRYLIALGSNLGDRLAYLNAARSEISGLGELQAHAPYYETKPLGAADQPFINSALCVISALQPETMLAELLRIEAKLGRVRRERWGNRVIDLDILLWQQAGDGGTWASQSWESPSLHIPHPQLLARDFVLVPAAQIAGTWGHPGTRQTLTEALQSSGFTLPER